MLRLLRLTSLGAGLLLATASIAQTPANIPSGSTGLCKDGSYWSGPTKKGACHGHKGVQTWYGTPAASGATVVTPPAAPAAPAPAPVAKSAAPMPAATAAPGGAPDKVWVNSSTKVYHCPSDRYYGKTKSGTYMSEAEAVAQGDRPDHGKACGK